MVFHWPWVNFSPSGCAPAPNVSLPMVSFLPDFRLVDHTVDYETFQCQRFCCGARKLGTGSARAKAGRSVASEPSRVGPLLATTLVALAAAPAFHEDAGSQARRLIRGLRSLALRRVAASARRIGTGRSP